MFFFTFFIVIFGLFCWFLFLDVELFREGVTFKDFDLWKTPLIVPLFISLMSLILFPLFIINLIFSIIFGIKNSKNARIITRWKCFLSYLFLGSIYKDYRKSQHK